MRADERHAAVAYAYAWWMTGDDDAAATALREALASPDPAEPGDEARLVALVAGVRRSLGDLRAMPPASELTLLHDGFGVPLAAAAELALVRPDFAASELAHGRMEALLETVRDEFRHPERLGGLAVGDAEDVEHAADCRSCSRARVLIERGRTELQQVSSVSAPPGLLARLVAEAAPGGTAARPDAEAQAQAPDAGETVAVHDILEGPGDYAVAGDDVRDAVAPPEAPEEIVLDDVDVEITIVDEQPAAPAGAAAPPPEAPADEAATAPPADLEAPAPERPVVPATPARRRAAGVLAGAGIVTASILVGVLIASGGEEEPTVPPPAEQPTTQGRPDSQQTDRPREREESEPAFGPSGGDRPGFSVTSAGLLLSGQNQIAPSGRTIDPQEPLRIAVDYENASRGVELRALWRVDDKVFQRLETIVSSRASRHVWGLPVPPDGWPAGRHRIVITADDSVAGAIDFTVEPD